MTSSLERYAAAFDHAKGARPRGWPDAIGRMSEEALDRFLALGFPTTRDEEWRFTNVAPIADKAFTSVPPPGGQPATPAGEVDAFRLPRAGAELVFVDGWFAPALSRPGTLPRGIRTGSLAAALTSDGHDVAAQLGRVAPVDRLPFVALNTAFLADGAWVQVPARMVVEDPVHLLFISTGAAGGFSISHPRVLIVLGEESQATVVETYAGAGDARYFTNAVTEIVLGDNAVLDHYKFQRESPEAYHIGAIHLTTHRNGNAASHSISLGGALVRNDIVAALDGEGSECTLNGLYLADGHRLVDNHTTIDHARPHCGSREIYKGILAGRARGVFNGKIIVRPDAQKTDAKQTNRALLLSEDAQINTKPQLEIFANDVKCTHGAAVGQLDDEAVFYMRSRGLGLDAARGMLIHAFAADVLNRMPLEPVRTEVEAILRRHLSRALAAAA
jgi:Fe-S cluster assembly protein SufD